MGLKEQLAKTSTARRITETIEGFGEVLFTEPRLSDLEEAQRRCLKYTVGAKGKESTVAMDTERSDMAGYNRALVALTVRDVGTGALVFEGPEDVADSFGSLDDRGEPRHGSGLFGQFLAHAQTVCGLNEPAEAKAKRAKGN